VTDTEPVAAPEGTRPPRVFTIQFSATIVAGLVYFLALNALIPVLSPYMKARFDAHNFEIGITIGAFALGAILLRPIAGRIGDIAGRRILVVAGAFIVAASFACYGLANSVATLTALRFLTGLGESGVYVGIATMAADQAPPTRRGAAMSYFSIAVYMGLAFGPALGESIYHRWGADPVWFVAAGLAATAAVIGIFLPETLTKGPKPSDLKRKWEPLLHRRTLKPGIVFFLGLIGLSGFTAFVPLYVGEIGLSDAAPVLFVYGFLILIIRVIGARYFDRIGGKRGTTIALSAAAAGLATMFFIENPFGLYLGTVVFAIGGAFLYTSVFMIVLDGLDEAERGSAVGTFSSFFDLALGVGAPLAGLVAGLFGYGAVFAFGALASLAGLAVFYIHPSMPGVRSTS